jgi:hypothetical protein
MDVRSGTRRPESRREWGESAALIVALALFIGLPNRYTIGGPSVMMALGGFLGIAVALSVFFTIIASGKWARLVMLVATTLLAIATLAAMVRLIALMVYSPANIDAHRLLTTGIGIWVFNVIIFAVLYDEMGEDDFSFPRPETEPTRRIVFLDYLFLSFTTATAFSPTDMSPLTTKARMAMMLEAIISLATLAIVAARAVNILK